MKRNKYLIPILITILAAFSLLVGCSSSDKEESNPKVVNNEKKPEVAEEDTKVLLSDWDGIWNNMAGYLEDSELEEAFVELSEREGVSVDQAIKDFAAGGLINFDGLIIEGNKVTLLDNFKDKDGQVIAELSYEYKDSITVKHGNFDTEWFAFKSDTDGEYQYLLMMPVHGEESLTHFHLRYGEDLEEILEKDDWYPILVKPSSTYGQLAAEVLE